MNSLVCGSKNGLVWQLLCLLRPPGAVLTDKKGFLFLFAPQSNDDLVDNGQAEAKKCCGLLLLVSLAAAAV